MKIYLRDQTRNFDKLLPELMVRPVMKFDKANLKKKVTTIDIKHAGDLRNADLDFLFDYKIFPPDIMSFMTQWSVEKRKMQVGDTILQQVFIPPIRSFSQKVVFGVRVNNIINEPSRKGFIYETIEGHVERESTFVIEQTERGWVFKIITFSTPGNFLTKLLGPVFTLPYQAYCTRRALKHVKVRVDSRVLS